MHNTVILINYIKEVFIMQKKDKKLSANILASVIIIVLIVLSLLWFMNANFKRIKLQTQGYVSDAATLSAERINHRFENAIDSIHTISSFTSKMIDSPVIDTDLIMELSNDQKFDYIEYISADGILTLASGETIDASDSEAYINGMKGESGLTAIFDRELSAERLFSFYTPLYYDNEIIGVLCGLYDNYNMEDIISSKFFGVTARSYLCSSDGTVIFSAGIEKPPKNILEAVSNSDRIIGKSEKVFFEVFEKHESQSFEYVRGNVENTAYIAPVDYNDWLLIQVFPPDVTSRMRSEADRAGVILVGCIIFAFLAYITFLLIMKRRRVRDLIDEKNQVSQIVESVTALFTRFAVVDLKNDTYYYVAKTDGVPPEGKYTDLINYMSQFYINEEGSVPMKEVVAREHIQEHLTKDVEYLQYQYHINRNEERWENVSLICLKRDVKGKPVSILYAVQNITELKQKEFESRMALENAFDTAKAANRAKSEFLSRMSHDIRTPMNAVMGMTAVASMHLDDKERVADCLEKISTSSRHLLALINDVLDMSKIESGKVTLSEEPFNLAEMTESILSIMHPQIKAKNQKISMSTSNIVHEDVIGDTLRLRQVFVNIMGNAVKFTPVEGSISLDIREVDSRIPGKACYEFVFTDTGIGMEQSYIDKIFEPFSRADSPDSKKIEGTGLGMPIAKNIVSMMDGDIKVESKIGEGSRFTVRLHLTIQNISETDAHCLDNLRILVADDDKNAADNTCDVLSSLGMRAQSVYGGEQAVEAVLKEHEKNDGFAAVILDWQMPDKNGIEATAEIRKKVGDTVPIIILSAYDWTDIEQDARQTGVNAFIAKPLFKSRLVYVLKSLIAPEKQEKAADKVAFTEKTYEGMRILLVEDNEINREIASVLLKMKGFEVEMAFDGKIAVDMITEKPENYYDLVFMDIQMPNMNGYESTKAIRASGREDLKKIPIIAMSADAFSDDVFRAKESGMNDHLSKPVEIPKLSEMLEKWLD